MTQNNVYSLTQRSLLLVLPFAFTACATISANQRAEPFNISQYKTVSIEPCSDRTGIAGPRDIATEATLSLHKIIRESGLFEIRAQGELRLTCDIERFEEGSALKRWLMPGWGATKAKIAIMVWEQPSQKVMSVLSTEASVEAGGFYTIGADQYIIDDAMNDIVSQLKKMADQNTPKGDQRKFPD